MCEVSMLKRSDRIMRLKLLGQLDGEGCHFTFLTLHKYIRR